uniref:Ribosomal L1 domain-containing protein 1 n=1 Tax=Poecilia reticulata TaxID=8081 RepID=A0A3P9PRY9_POERE
AVQALQSFLKSKSREDVLLLDDGEPISLLFSLWKIPRQTPLPHGQRSDTDQVCLFTKDEPRMTAEQNQRFYRKLLEERGVTSIIPLKTLKKEYKPHEAKRRLLGNFDVFLSDERIRRLLPSHLGKHFYATKKMPISINLQSSNLGRNVQRLVQGTRLTVTNRGSCRSDPTPSHQNHSNLQARTERINREADPPEESDLGGAAHLHVRPEARPRAAETPGQMKMTFIKTRVFIFQPTSSNVCDLQEKTTKGKKNEAGDETTKEQKKKKKQGDDDDDEEEEEEIPQLVPIETPSKRPRMQVGVSSSLCSPTSAPSSSIYVLMFQKPTRPAAAKKVTTGSKVTTRSPVTKASIKATRKAVSVRFEFLNLKMAAADSVPRFNVRASSAGTNKHPRFY